MEYYFLFLFFYLYAAYPTVEGNVTTANLNRYWKFVSYSRILIVLYKQYITSSKLCHIHKYYIRTKVIHRELVNALSV